MNLPNFSAVNPYAALAKVGIALAIVAAAYFAGDGHGESREHVLREADVARLGKEKSDALLQISGFAAERQALVDKAAEAQRTALAAVNLEWKGKFDAQQKTASDARAAYDRGLTRVRVQATCPARDSAGSDSLPRAPTDPGLADGTTVELSGAAGRNVLDIKAGVARDRAKLEGWQARARALAP